MSTLRLRIVDKSDLENGTRIISQDNQDKQKNKRGRPRKILQNQQSDSTVQLPVADIIDTVLLPKKRGRKKKCEVINLGENIMRSSENCVPKSYIVHLKIKSSDLEKIQTQFINKSQKIGYENDGVPVSNDTKDTGYNLNSEDNTQTSDYYAILNKLELPFVPYQAPQQTVSLFSPSSPFTSQPPMTSIPEIPHLYQTIVIPILPENVPIKLFEDSQKPRDDDQCDTYRDTNNLMLPLLDNHDKWPEKSPYACWNCDFHFNGTPWGIPDTQKEPIDGKFRGYGNFCSPECTARYLVDRENTLEFWDKYSTLCLIYQMVYNLNPEIKVPVAPPRESLSKYGGKLSYENYHNAAKHDQIVEIYKLPMVPVRLHIGEISRSSNIDNLLQKAGQAEPRVHQHKQRRCIPIDPVKMSQAEENLKQRTRDLLRNHYTLDRCLQEVK